MNVANDGFENLLTGAGTTRDPSSYNDFKRGRSLTLNYEFISSLYAQNWLASAVVNVPSNDMTRNWIEVTDEEEELHKKIKDDIDRLKVPEKINQALKYAGAYGGAIIIMLVDDGKDLAEELNIKSISDKGIQNLIVLDRWRVSVGPLHQDLLSPDYGMPQYYMVSRSGQQIHHSRVLRFDGEIPSILEFEKQGYWGNSSYEKNWQTISNSQMVSQEIASMTKESNIDVFHIEGLNAMVALGKDGATKVIERISVASQQKSIYKAIILDKEDTYEKKSNTFAGLSEIDNNFLLKVAGSSQIPLSKLLGKTDAGLNGNGEGDLKNYYDNLNGRQVVEMTSPIQTVLDIIYWALTKKEKNISWEFESLWQMSQEQKAKIELDKANRDAIYLDRGVVSPETIQNELSSESTYNNISDDIDSATDLFDNKDDLDENQSS